MGSTAIVVICVDRVVEIVNATHIIGSISTVSIGCIFTRVRVAIIVPIIPNKISIRSIAVISVIIIHSIISVVLIILIIYATRIVSVVTYVSVLSNVWGISYFIGI